MSPLPLHKSRLKERGYNQSACFAEGLAEKLKGVVEVDNLVRVRTTATQTHKSRFSRFENMQEVFTVMHPEKLVDKHVLLVDDIVTTGSTLEACSFAVIKSAGAKVEYSDDCLCGVNDDWLLYSTFLTTQHKVDLKYCRVFFG